MAISPNAPTNLWNQPGPGGPGGGSPFQAVPMQSTGTLSGYTLTPALRYSYDGGRTYNNLPGVTLSGWSALIMGPQFAGPYSMTVSDSTVTGAVAFTVLGYGG